MKMIRPYMGIIDHLSQLPLEIQLLILQKLNYVEFSRFNAVCKDWRSIASAARKSPSFSLQQVPWLIHALTSLCEQLPNKLSHHMNALFKLELFHDSSSVISVSSSKGPMINKYPTSICGSSQGWLLLKQYCSNSFLLNPLTGQRISLPSNPENSSTFFNLHVGVLLPHDQSADDMEVVAYFRDDSFYQWRSNDEHWTRIAGFRGNPSIFDMIYHKGSIYAVYQPSSCLCIFTINISSDRTCYCTTAQYATDLFPSSFPKFVHLVECDGDLLMVVSPCKSYETVPQEVVVFKFINPLMDWDWEEVTSIGEKHALLVGKGSSMAIDASTNSTSGFRANCVYFLDDHSGQGQGIRCFDLGNKTFGTFMPYSWKGEATPPTWFIPPS